MYVTQKDIADRLQISRSLVGAVLNNKAGSWVSLETKRRIFEAAEQMKYRPNAAAKALRSGKTQAVAFHFFPPQDWGHQIAGSMIEFLAEELGLLNYRLIVNAAIEGNDRALHDLITSRCCDAVVLFGTESQVEPHALLLSEAGMPFIIVGGRWDQYPQWYRCDYDHAGMMEQCVARLVALGHQKIAYLGHDNEEKYAQRLLAGFRQAAIAHLSPGASPPLEGRGGSFDTTGTIMGRWLSLPIEEQPTALVLGTPDSAVWQDMEIVLAMSGRRLGGKTSDFTAIGLLEGELSLLYGDAWAFRLHDRKEMSQQMVTHLLAPILRDEAVANPDLVVLPSFAALSGRRYMVVERAIGFS